MPRLKVQLLGDFSAELDGHSLSQRLTSREGHLFVYLILHLNAPQPRNHIAFIFWPDISEKQALSNLRTLYSRLARKIPNPETYIKSNRQTIYWQRSAPFSLDTAQFETAVSTAQTIPEWQNAVALYKGLLLPGWYAEWLQPERDRLQGLFTQAAETLIELQEDRRLYAEAIATAQHLLRYDALRESAYRDLMRLQALNGETAAALRTYHTCTSILENELGASPDQLTQELYQQLLQGDTQKTTIRIADSDPIFAPLTGRDREWQELRKAWHATTRGRARAVFISGEAGVGKSRLAFELQNWAERQGIDTLIAGAFEAEGELAYAPIITWLRSATLKPYRANLDDLTLTELARLVPEILVDRLDLPAPPPPREPWQRQRLFEGLARAVLSLGRPLLLVLDDLQWCDQETLQWLHFLLRFDEQSAVLLIGTFRPEEIDQDHPLNDLRLSLKRSRQLQEMELLPLSPEQTAELITSISSQPLNEQELERYYHETEGNPLFVIEMMRSGGFESSNLPSTIQALILSRFAHLSPQARELMFQAAVIRRAFDFDLLQRSSSFSEENVVIYLDELWRRRIIREQSSAEYDFSHQIIGHCAYDSLSLVYRQLLHRRVAEALENRHKAILEPFSGRIAFHFEMAGLPSKALPYYRIAAQGAQQLYANQEAITYIRKGLSLISQLEMDQPVAAMLQEKGTLLEMLGDVLHFITDDVQAVQAYRQAISAVSNLDEQDSIWHARLQRKIGSALLTQYHYEQALEQFEYAKATLGDQPRQPEKRWWQEWIAIQQERKYSFYWLNRWPEIEIILEESRPILENFGTAAQRAYFLDIGPFLRRDRFVISPKVLGYAREWFAANMEVGDPALQPPAHFFMGFVLLWYGDFNAAESEMQIALQKSKKTGDINLQTRLLTYLAILYRKQNLDDQVRQYTTAARSSAIEASMPEYLGTAEANLAWLAWREQDLERAAEHGHHALDYWQTLPAGHASAAFQWTALFPLMACALNFNQLQDGKKYAQALLNPTQQKLPDSLETALQDAINAIDHNSPEIASKELHEILQLAQYLGYL